MPEPHAIEAWATAGLAVLTLLTLIVAVISLRSASKDQAQALRTAAIQSISTQVMELGKWLTDHKGYRDALSETNVAESEGERTTREAYEAELSKRDGGKDAVRKLQAERMPGAAIAAVYADFMDHVLSQERLLDAEYMEPWKRWITARVGMYPSIRETIDINRDWYGDHLRRLAGVPERTDDEKKRRLEELKEARRAKRRQERRRFQQS